MIDKTIQQDTHTTTTVHTVGPKPAEQRALSAFVKKVGFYAFYFTLGWHIIELEAVNQRVLDVAYSAYTMLNTDVTTPEQGTALQDPVWVVDGMQKISLMDPFTYTFFDKKTTMDVLVTPEGGQVVETRQEKTNTRAFLTYLREQLHNPEEALMIVAMYQRANSAFVMGVHDPELQAQERDKQRNARIWLISMWQALQDQDREAQTHLFSQIKDDRDIKVDLKHARKDFAHHLWEGVGYKLNQPNIPDAAIAIDSPQDITLSQARSFLSKAVARTGLAGLYVSENARNNPRKLYQIGVVLYQSNHSLARMTKFDGGVLGLHQRVILDMRREGMTAVTIKNLTDPYLRIKSGWASLPHEWFHALDFAQSEYVKRHGIGKTGFTTLSEHNHPAHAEWSKMGDPCQLADAQHTLWTGLAQPVSREDQDIIVKEYKINTDLFLVNALTEKTSTMDTSPAFYLRNKYEEMARSVSTKAFLYGDDGIRYLQDPAEILARSFDDHTHLHDNTKVPVFSGQKNMASVGFSEMTHETKLKNHVWNNYFSTLNTWWRHDEAQRKHLLIESTPPSTVISVKQPRL